MTVLVTGATGMVGRNVVARLVELGVPVRALTRDPARASFPDGVEVVRGDLAEPAGLAPAFDGVEAVHLITFDGGTGAPLTTGPELLKLAEHAGVRRVTVLHGGGPSPLEDAVRAGGIAWTVLMPVEFMGNALQWAPSIRDADEVREPFADRLSAMVHEADIGAVAAVALTQDGHAGREYVITGPQVLTLRDKLDAIGTARGSEVRLVELTADQARAEWLAAGLPDEVIEFLVVVYGSTPPVGRTVTDTVPRLTGRPARTFEQWAHEHADAFRA